MPEYNENIQIQQEKITEAKQSAGLWSVEQPEWIQHFDGGTNENFWEWFQFIHPPICINDKISRTYYLAPQLRPK